MPRHKGPEEKEEDPMNGRRQVRPIWIAALWGMFLCVVIPGASGQEGRKAVVQTTPVYPALARSSQLRGIVKVQIVIAADGQIKETKVIGGSPVFVAAALDALKTWRYTPSQSETTTQLEFEFHP
jgi:TonB family protein